jgi:GT2 family glycosyltransferase
MVTVDRLKARSSAEPLSGAVRICALVVTFNRKTLLLDCLEALLKQTYALQAICIVDNASSDGTPEALYQAGYLGSRQNPPADAQPSIARRVVGSRTRGVEIHYIRNSENSGGAGGFWAAMRIARRYGYDGYWLMDDDALAAPTCLEALVGHWKTRGVVGLASMVTTRGEIALMHRGYFDFKFNRVYPTAHRAVPATRYSAAVQEIDMASFVGLLVKDDAVRDVGLPRRKFFIQHDDTEYCIRLRMHGKILLVPSSRIEHREAEFKTPRVGRYLFLRSPRQPGVRLPGLYFSLRNLTWVGRKYHRSAAIFAWATLVSWARASLSVMIFDRDQRMRRLGLIAAAYLEGLRGRFDNDKPWRYRA